MSAADVGRADGRPADGVDRLEDPARMLEEGRRVLRLEAAAVEALVGRLGSEFVDAGRLVAGTTGRVIVSGIGKSGIVARKLAATLAPGHYTAQVVGVNNATGVALIEVYELP